MRKVVQRDFKPDAQPFDEVRILTVPRYKESYLSGDEWRISAKIQFWRKGRIIQEVSYGRNVESAIMGLGGLFQGACDGGKGLYAGEDDLCDQEGCAALATVTFRKKANYERFSGMKSEIAPHTVKIRRFCDRHKVRGDCDLDDADSNYEDISNG